MPENWRYLEINGGKVTTGERYRLLLQPAQTGYSDAQFDDYGNKGRRQYLWNPGTSLSLAARFSHPLEELVGTAGFGFWNAPFGDPTVGWPALPRATWFFFASHPSDLPLALQGPGRGWFASTIDAGTLSALYLAPLSLPILVLNNSLRFRNRYWPVIRQKLKISYFPIEAEIEEWHHYRLEWQREYCEFWIDGNKAGSTKSSPRGPMGFVCWMDNQYLVATNTGRLRWGTLPTARNQWLEVADLGIARF